MTRTLVVTKRMNDHPADSHTIERYEATGGYQQAKRALGLTRDELVEEVKSSGLLGRGGAAFSAGLKWSFLASARPAYLVVNGDESEPGTFKDRQLLERDPHQMIDGIVITSAANEVHHAFIYIRGEYPKAARRVQAAVDEAYAKGYLGKGIFGSDHDLEVTVHLGGGAYICGEETALINSLEGLRGEPRLKPPYFPAAKGLYMLPTIVNNVETVSNLPHILEMGAGEYSRLTGSDDTGTFMMSLSGHVNRPGVYEQELGIRLSELVEKYCGGIRGGKKYKAAIPGGISMGVLGTDQYDAELDFDVGKKYGCLGLGTAGVIVFDQDTDMVGVARNIARFFAHESCGQCTPCREGTDWMYKTLTRIEQGGGTSKDLDLLLEIAGSMGAMPGTTICGLADGANWAVRTIINKFRGEFEKKLTKKRYVSLSAVGS